VPPLGSATGVLVNTTAPPHKTAVPDGETMGTRYRLQVVRTLRELAAAGPRRSSLIVAKDSTIR